MVDQTRSYVVTVGDAPPLVVELRYDSAAQRWWAEVDGERLALHIDSVDAAGRVHAEIDGERLVLDLERGPAGAVLREGGADAGLPIRAASPGEILLGSAAPTKPAVRQGEAEVTAPITGEVLEVCVTVGDTVVGGQTLVVLEAMKMETPVRSPHAAQVHAVLVALGDRVRTGAALVVLA